ncbi:MAG: NAD(+)/NADH kinase [Deinococcota bacterium]
MAGNGDIFTKSVFDLDRVVLASSLYKPQAHPVTKDFAQKLQERGIETILDLEGTAKLSQVAKGADMVIAVGGDGTILSSARRMAGTPVPTLGINMGKLGFLAEHSIEDAYAFLDGDKQGCWRLSPKMMLEIRLHNSVGTTTCYALNDVTVSQGIMTRLLGINMSVDGYHATQYHADGLIISTPVGSTAYSLSVGGPILGQGLQALMVTPIAPHSLTNRPIVIESLCTISFRIDNPADEMALVVDGQERLELHGGDYFTVSAAKTDFMLIASDKHSSFDILRQKLGWGTTPSGRKQDAPKAQSAQSEG